MASNSPPLSDILGSAVLVAFGVGFVLLGAAYAIKVRYARRSEQRHLRNVLR
jgi:hypothetical protein